MAPQTEYKAAPPSLHYEFGGPIGALGITLACPFFTYWLASACTADACPRWPLSELVSWHQQGWHSMFSDAEWWKSFFSWEATAAYFAWYAFNVVCWGILPGETCDGGVMRNGEKLSYRNNGP